MENDKNLNNQVNTDNNLNQQMPNNNTNKIVLVIIVGIIITLIWYIVYIKFLQKIDNSEAKHNNMQEQDNNNSKQNEKENDLATTSPTKHDSNKSSTPTPSPTPKSNNSVASQDIGEEYLKQYKITEKVIYKSKNSKNELIIEPSEEDYYAYFNGKKIGAGIAKLGKYLLVEGYEIGVSSQCGEYSYIVNLETNSLVDLYTKNLLDIIKFNDNYYFREYICGNGDVVIYDENLNKIGTNYIVADKKNFYILDGNIVKYDSNGKIVFKSSEVYNLAEYYDIGAMADDTGVYIIIVSNGEIFFIDSNVENLKPIKIGTTSEYNGLPCAEGEVAIFPMENGKIKINLDDKQDRTVEIIYDIKTKTISK